MSQRSLSRRARSTKSDIGAATRADLLAAGRKLFARRGYDGTSVRAITKTAGTNLGAVTYHFGTKQALYSAVLDQVLRPLAERVQLVAGSEGSALERMLKVVEAYFDYFQAHPELPHLLLQEVTAGKKPPQVVIEIVSRVKHTIAGLHQEGVADGSVRDGHPVLFALSVISQPIYLALVAPLLRAVGPLDLSDPRARRMALDHILAFVRAGLEPARR
jgi:AcrR family transcriptional regulator